MKIREITRKGLMGAVLGMSLLLAGIGFAQQSTTANDSNRFIQRFDKDGDGMVSTAEFQGPEEHFTSLDTNEDGYIDASEAPKGPPPHGMKGGGFIAKFDKDGDGKVSKAEFSGPADHFTRLDGNKDGYIDASESPKGPPPHGMKGGGFIARFDKDGDGKVSKAEFSGPADHFARLDVNKDGYIDASETPRRPQPE